MRLQLRPSVLLWIGLLAYFQGPMLLPFLGAAVFHELGHLLALRRMGVPPRNISIGLLGAVIETPSMSYLKELLAAAAGPGASLLLGLALPFWPLLGFYSLALACVNLLPLPGLDGGRMLRSGLLLVLPESRAHRISDAVGLLTGLVLWGLAAYGALAFHLGLWPLFLAAGLLLRAIHASQPDQTSVFYGSFNI